MLFNDRMLVIDMGSLTAQSYSAAKAQVKSKQDEFSLELANKGTYIFFQSTVKLSKSYGPPVFCMDKFPRRKLNQYPKYKEDRFSRYEEAAVEKADGTTEAPETAEPSVFQKFRAVLKPVLDLLPALTVYAYGEEADDVVFAVLHKLVKYEGRFIKGTAFSRDNDMMQIEALPHSRLLLKKGHQEAFIVTETDVMKTYGVRADQVALYKAFLGDAGDSVPKVQMMHAKRVVEDVIGNRTTVQEVLDAYMAEEIDTSKWHKNWEDYFSEFVGYDWDTGEITGGQALINEKIVRLEADLGCVFEYRSGDYAEFEKAYTAAVGKLVHSLPPVEIWNHFVQKVTLLLKYAEANGVPVAHIQEERNVAQAAL